MSRLGRARSRARSPLATAKRLGLPYARIAWELCIVLDNLGETEEAVQMGVEAVDQDPLAPEYRHSLFLATEKLKSEVSGLDPEDPSIPRLHALLAANDAAEEDTHIALARHLLVRGEGAQARRLLEAVTTLAPNCTEAWRLQAQVNEAVGDDEARDRCEFEALAAQSATDSALATLGAGPHLREA